MGSYIDVLLRLERYEQARQVAHDALDRCRQFEIGASSHEIVRGLALAEARLGDFESAWARLERVIEEQVALKVTGLQLGASYEACTRIAIWSGDIVRLQRYAALTAREYRHGRGSPLGARYERLMEEARGTGLEVVPELTDFVSTAMPITRAEPTGPSPTSLLDTLIGETDRNERAQRALRVLCNARGARGGHLYLCTDHGIVLAASEGLGEPPDGLPEFLEHYLRVEEGEGEIETAVATAADLKSTMDLTRWADVGGNVHRPLVLIASVDGVERQVAVASFVVDGEAAVRPQQVQLNGAIAAYLIGAGDPALIRTGSTRTV
jgi:hypothetical protein